MWAAGVVDLGLAPDVFWALTPVEFDHLFDRHLRREQRDDRRAALIATYIANYSGRMRKDGDLLTVDDLLSHSTPSGPGGLDRFRRAVENAPQDFISRLKSDPNDEVILSQAVIDAASGGSGTWSKLGAEERPLQPVSIIRRMHPEWKQ